MLELSKISFADLKPAAVFVAPSAPKSSIHLFESPTRNIVLPMELLIVDPLANVTIPIRLSGFFVFTFSTKAFAAAFRAAFLLFVVESFALV